MSEETIDVGATNVTALANSVQQNDTMATITRMRRGASEDFVGNFDPASDDDCISLMAVELGRTININDECPVTLNVVHVHVRTFESVDRQSGEIEGKLRTTLLLDNGALYSTNAPAVARVALSLLSSSKGRKRFEPPLALSFDKVKTQNGQSCIVCSADIDAIKVLYGKTSESKNGKKK